jgi:hypothetical protein
MPTHTHTDDTHTQHTHTHTHAHTRAPQNPDSEIARKKAEAERLRAAEKFMVIGSGTAQCKGCGCVTMGTWGSSAMDVSFVTESLHGVDASHDRGRLWRGDQRLGLGRGGRACGSSRWARLLLRVPAGRLLQQRAARARVAGRGRGEAAWRGPGRARGMRSPWPPLALALSRTQRARNPLVS